MDMGKSIPIPISARLGANLSRVLKGMEVLPLTHPPGDATLFLPWMQKNDPRSSVVKFS
ncbi:MAG: hypothetical protein GY862_36860 [Gammaproteobacteria bacterium]|nr:hypothetical protein [Gammaproteobacteria bacterium]